MEKGFRNIFLVAGVIVAGIGALVIWRGVTEMIPLSIRDSFTRD